MDNRWDERRSGTFNAAAKGEVTKPAPADSSKERRAYPPDDLGLHRGPRPPGGHAPSRGNDQEPPQKSEGAKPSEKGPPLSKIFNGRSR